MTNSEERAAVAFPPVVIPVEGLVSPGDTIARQGVLDLEGLTNGGRAIGLPDGLSYDVALTHTGDGILATGIVRGHAVTACDRCLEPASFDIAAELSCYYLHEEPEDEVADEQDFGLIDEENGCVDLSEAIQGAVAMEIPYVILCKDDCKGLCPVCGANLNEGDCGCVIVPDPDFERKNPFAALAGYTFADGTTVADHADELASLDGDDPDEGDDVPDDEFEAEWDRLHAQEEPGI